MRSLLSLLSVITISFFVLSCGGDGGEADGNGGSEGTGTVTLGGSPVENLRYESGNKQGFTNSSGEFNYEGDIDFYIGSIRLGSIQGSDNITILDTTKATYGEDYTTSDLNVRELILLLDSDVKPSNGIQIKNQAHSLFNLNEDSFSSDGVSKLDDSSEFELFLLNRNDFTTNEKLSELIHQYSGAPTTIGDWDGYVCTVGYYSNHLGQIDEDQLEKTRAYDLAQSFIGDYACNFNGTGHNGSFSFQTDLSFHCNISGRSFEDGSCNGNTISSVNVNIDHESGDVEMNFYCQGWLHFYGTASEDGGSISGDFGSISDSHEPLGTFSCSLVSR